MNEREMRKRRAERYIVIARLVLLWERLWPSMWPGMGIVGAGMILALVGLFGIMPGALHALFLLMFFGVTGYVFWRAFQPLKSPRWEEGARRVERDSDLPNRPITEGMDVVAAGKGDPFAFLWNEFVCWRTTDRAAVGLCGTGLTS